jgi:hypothetical protein
LLLWLPPDLHERGGQGQHKLYHTLQHVLFRLNVEGLKNAGSTFSRLTKKVLESQVGRNIFTYVDDIVVASKNKEDHLADLAATFANMREARLWLNPEKCVFGVCQGKILGYLVSHRGIEANPTKIQAIIDMAPLQSTRDVQRLIGRLAALNRFISKSAERSLPFLKTLRGAKDFTWGPEQAVAFESLKQHLSNLATLTSPDPSLPLLLYIAASPCAVSAALVQEQDREGTSRQCLVYYVSEVLMTSKCNMTELEKKFIRSRYGIAQTAPLLRGIQSTGHFGQGSGRIVQEPGGIRLNRQMGSRTLRVPHHLRTQNNDQITSPGRLHR